MMMMMMIIIILVTTFTQRMYSYMPVTNHVSRVHNVTAILWLQYMVQLMLCPLINVLYFHKLLFETYVQ